MDPETAARAFEPFFTTKPAGQGTGLGLATVYGIVTQAGGNARIYSEPGRGTLVSIHLPAIDQPVLEAAARDGKTSPIQGNGETILVVEDEPAVLLAAIRTLGSNGYELLSESTPSAALDRIADRGIRIDLLLTDVVMPGLSGIELARRARELRPELRVVFMSGYSHEVITRQGNVPTEAAIVQKPFTRRELLRALHETLLPAR
jgi:CheY-like chemotaxis protein